MGEDLLAYHQARAEGGVGLTVLETASVHPSSGGSFEAWNDGFLAAYARLLEALHRTPMKLFQQLWHSGRTFNPLSGAPPWAPSRVPGPQLSATELSTMPVAISQEQIDELVAGFAAAAARVAGAGVDGIEVHAAHGYLLGQFLSPLTNRREDGYGGSFQNRLRLLSEILAAVRSEVRGALPVGIRISAAEMVPGGLTAGDVEAVALELERRGLLDFIDLSLGSPMNYPKVIGAMDEPNGYELPFSVPVARAVAAPAIVGGRITSLQQVEEILARGDAELVSMVRAHIADPEVVAKSRRGEAHRVRPCIACNQGCVGRDRVHPLGCTVNPVTGYEAHEPPPRRAAAARTVVVAGGGPAGMEAARVAAERGHRVVLFEAATELGGQLRLARRAPHRAEIGRIADWLAAELRELGVEVRTGCRLAGDAALELEPDAVVVATGSVPRRDGVQIARPQRLSLAGVGLPHVVTSWEAFDRHLEPGARAVVLDDVGHHEAVSVAEALLDQGASVTVVSRLPRLAPLLEPPRMDGTVKERLYPRAFDFLADSELLEIEADRVRVGSIYGGRERALPADLVVLVLANEPQDLLARELKGRVAELHVAGDALSPRFLQIAIAEGHRAGLAASGLSNPRARGAR